jgi:hypothetical protein
MLDEAEESRLDRSNCHTELPLRNFLKTWVMMMMMMVMRMFHKYFYHQS